MLSKVSLDEHADVVAALKCPQLVPPDLPGNVADGPTADLRDAMARFSRPELHRDRRRDVERAINSLRDFPFTDHANERANSILRHRPDVDAECLGQVVPTMTLALALGVPDAELASVAHQVLELVKVIGRGAASTEQSDESTRQLIDRFSQSPGGPVAAISLLYQNHDATAALLAAVIAGQADSLLGPRKNALTQTTRVAQSLVIVNDTRIAPRTVVQVSLAGPGLEFGAGPHSCPGQAIAESIVSGIARAVGTSQRV